MKKTNKVYNWWQKSTDVGDNDTNNTKRPLQSKMTKKLKIRQCGKFKKMLFTFCWQKLAKIRPKMKQTNCNFSLLNILFEHQNLQLHLIDHNVKNDHIQIKQDCNQMQQYNCITITKLKICW